MTIKHFIIKLDRFGEGKENLDIPISLENLVKAIKNAPDGQTTKNIYGYTLRATLTEKKTNNMKDFKVCKRCLGECPENCEMCVYSNCKKQVDYALTQYKWEHMISFIGTDQELKEEQIFYKWFKSYFNLDSSYKRN